MLKVKDDVDLKELEKFGFKPKYDKDTGEIICEECLLESDGVTTSTITNYFVDGEFIGDDSQSIQDVVDHLCEIFDYEQIEEG